MAVHTTVVDKWKHVAVIIDTNRWDACTKLSQHAKDGLRVVVPSVVVYEQAYRSVMRETDNHGSSPNGADPSPAPPEQVALPRAAPWGAREAVIPTGLLGRVEQKHQEYRGDLLKPNRIEYYETHDPAELAHMATYLAAMKQYPFYTKRESRGSRPNDGGAAGGGGKFVDSGYKDFVILHAALELSRTCDVILLTSDKGLRGEKLESCRECFLVPHGTAMIHGSSASRIRMFSGETEGLRTILEDTRTPLEQLLDPRVRVTVAAGGSTAVAKAFCHALMKWNVSGSALGVSFNPGSARLATCENPKVQHIETKRRWSPDGREGGYVSSFRIETAAAFNVHGHGLPTGPTTSTVHQDLTVEECDEGFYRLSGNFLFEMDLIWDDAWPYAMEAAVVIREPVSGESICRPPVV